MNNKPKTIFRNVKNKENPYVMIDKRISRSKKISMKAKGILLYLLSCPDEWEVNIVDICNHATEGVSAIRSGLRELFNAGYCKYECLRDEKQQIAKWTIQVFEVPQESPSMPDKQQQADLDSDFRNVGQNLDGENLQVGFLEVGNRTQVINELSNKELNNNLGAKNAPAPAEPVEQTPTRRTDAHLKGDALDGILHYSALGADPARALQARILEYPPDCQQTLTWLTELFGWPLAAIPARPTRGSKGGAYAQWILEINEINRLIAGVGKPVLEAAKVACANISVSHPAAINWCLPGEVGKILQYREKQTQVTETPLTQALRTFRPRQAA